MKFNVFKFFSIHRNARRLARKGIAHGRKAFCGPEQVVIDLTNRCNNSCIGCWTRSPLLGSNKPDPAWHGQSLSTDRGLKLIDELHAMGLKRIRFTGGGEPFMHRGIFKLIRRAKSYGIHCAVTTNLTPLDMDSVQEIVESGLDELAVSVWATSAAEYVATHPNQSEAAFDKITRMLHEIHAIKKRTRDNGWPMHGKTAPWVNILNVICNLNHRSIAAMYDYAIDCGADAVYYTLVDPIEGSTDSLLLSEKEKEEVKRACSIIREKNTLHPKQRRLVLDGLAQFEKRVSSRHADSGHYDQTHVDMIPCYIGWLFCRIMADGQVSPCCRGVHHTMGNINEHAFATIWNSEKYNTFREKAKFEKKSIAYFSPFKCQKTCDNFAHNLEMHNWLKQRKSSSIFQT